MPTLKDTPITEGVVSIAELLAKITAMAHTCNATSAIVVLFTAAGEYKSFQFNCEDDEYIKARRVILAHSKMRLVEH